MSQLLCQVCAGPASYTEDEGWLFLDWRRATDPKTWPEGIRTTMPPVCVAHALQSVERCPKRGIFVPVRAQQTEIWGVAGVLHKQTSEGWVTSDDEVQLAYGDPQLHAMLANKLIRVLHKVTVLDIEQFLKGSADALTEAAAQ